MVHLRSVGFLSAFGNWFCLEWCRCLEVREDKQYAHTHLADLCCPLALTALTLICSVLNGSFHWTAATPPENKLDNSCDVRPLNESQQLPHHIQHSNSKTDEIPELFVLAKVD